MNPVDLTFGIVGGTVAVLLFVGVIAILRSLVRVCPSNHILVVTGGTETTVGGRKYGFRIQKGGWTFVVPFLQSAQTIELTILPINVRVEGVNSANGISVGADASACVCIDDDKEDLLYSAVQQLLGKSRTQIQEQIQQTMIGNFRAALNKTTPLQAIGMVDSAEGVGDVELMQSAAVTARTAVGDGGSATGAASEGRTLVADTDGERALFRQFLLEDCQEDLSAFGMEVVSVSLQRIWDTSNYIANLANKTLSRKRQDVEIEEARLRARADRAESDAKRRMLVAENHANERILAARQEVELFRRQCEAQVTRARLEADSSISQAQSTGQRQVQETTVELQLLRNQSEVTLEAEARRRAAESIAAGQGSAVQLVQGARNELLQMKVSLLKDTGDVGRVALFIMQLPALFGAYNQHAAKQHVDTLLVLNEDSGFNAAVNRGPAAMVDFLSQLEAGFGVDIKALLTGRSAVATEVREEVG